MARKASNTFSARYVLALEAVVSAARLIVEVQPVDTGYVGRELALKQALIQLDEAFPRGR